MQTNMSELLLKLGIPKTHLATGRGGLTETKLTKLYDTYITKEPYSFFLKSDYSYSGRTTLLTLIIKHFIEVQKRPENLSKRKSMKMVLGISEIQKAHRAGALEEFVELDYLLIDNLPTNPEKYFHEGFLIELLQKRAAAGVVTIITYKGDRLEKTYSEALKDCIESTMKVYVHTEKPLNKPEAEEL